jgi:uncharacterized protein (DUF1778 family)
MHFDEYTQQVHEQLRAAAALGDERTQQVAAALATAAESAVRLAILAALSDAAAELTSTLAATGGPAVTVALDGDEIRVDIVSAALPDEAPSPADEGEASARISLRLSEKLKSDVEQAAGRDGVSVNTWLVRAAGAALNRPAGGWPGGWGASAASSHGRGANRVTGWVTG